MVEDSPGEVQGPDALIIRADVPGHERIQRTVICPLSMPGSGRRLMGQAVGFRHTSLDPDFADDVLVVRWPAEVRKALQPPRLEGPGAVRARVWGLLSRCCAVVAVSGILLSVVMLIGVVFTGGELFADLPSWFRPGRVLAASLGAAVLGTLVFVACQYAVARRLPD
ncbi:hypothetical protein ASG90_18800 [Nocardioides sp. Soil797]|nr:hypothetical protein ASG90_18800 [Nocardioides sp. Soil797]